MTQGEAEIDMASLDPRRYGGWMTTEYAARKNEECYSHVFVLHHPDEERYVENVVRACERAQVRLVYLGVHVHARWRWVRALLRATLGLLLFPHYARRLRAGVSEAAG